MGRPSPIPNFSVRSKPHFGALSVIIIRYQGASHRPTAVYRFVGRMVVYYYLFCVCVCVCVFAWIGLALRPFSASTTTTTTTKRKKEREKEREREKEKPTFDSERTLYWP